jgi:hypothetical protein
VDEATNKLFIGIAKQRDEVMEICRESQLMLEKAINQRDALRVALQNLVDDDEHDGFRSNCIRCDLIAAAQLILADVPK